jgi:hypothetical protein
MCAVPNMAAFCSSLMSFSPDILFGYSVNDFHVVPLTPVVTAITSAEALIRCPCFILHMRSMHSISIVTSFYVTFLSPEIAVSINIHVPCSLTPTVTSGLFLRMVLSIFHFSITEHGYLTFMTYFYHFWYMVKLVTLV